jgi:osmotically-inducible protein OsmY
MKKTTFTRATPWRAALAVVAASAALAGCIPAIVAGGLGIAAVANDRRTNDAIIADERIERTANYRMKNELKEDARVNVSAFNRIVLLSGEAKSEAIKAEAQRIASLVDGVRGVHNEIDVMDLRRPRDQFSDATTTTQVKARMVGNGVFNPIHVQASTDGGTVYLQGLLTKAEADEAARIASTTQGVRKVVRLFEIVPDGQYK